MAEFTLAEIDLDRYGRWWLRATGGSRPLVVCDSTGVPHWSTEAPDGAVQAALAAATESGLDWHAEGDQVRSHGLDGKRSVLYAPVMNNASRCAAWLATLVEHGDAPPSALELDELADALQDLAAGASSEMRMLTDLNDMAGELAERYEELHLVYELDRHMQHASRGREVFRNLLETCAAQLGVDVAAFVSPDQDLEVHAVNLSKPMHNLDLVLVEMRGDLYRFANSSRQTVVLNRQSDPRRAYIFTDMPYKVLAAPVYSGDVVIGVLAMVNHEFKPDFSNSDRRLVQVMANQFSNINHMCQMLDEMQTFTEQMAAALIECVEAKDPYTRGHSERVHRIAMDIGRAMGLDSIDLEHLFWSSLLHDVGKIGIPDAVLCKPGRLTQDEYTFIKVHPERSYEILRHIDRLAGALPGARYHQEKYDGTGYPRGLKGQAIPLAARIIAVADTYDSITSSRAYRSGRSHAVAMQEIERVTGTQLDPDVVAVFRGLCQASPKWLGRAPGPEERELA